MHSLLKATASPEPRNLKPKALKPQTPESTFENVDSSTNPDRDVSEVELPLRKDAHREINSE